MSDGNAVVELAWSTQGGPGDRVTHQAACEIAEYFAGDRQVFDVAVALPQSDFMQRFCLALLEIEFGQTCTYGDLAKILGAPAQAIGQACGANKIPILIPCHRVLAANSLGGYSGAGGIETKVTLLRHEGAAGLLI